MYWLVSYLVECIKLSLTVFVILPFAFEWKYRRLVWVGVYSIAMIAGAILPFLESVKTFIVTCLVLLTIVTFMRQKQYWIAVVGSYFLIGIMDAAVSGIVCGLLGWNSRYILDNYFCEAVLNSLSLPVIVILSIIKKNRNRIFDRKAKRRHFYFLEGGTLLVLVCLIPLQKKVLDAKDKKAVIQVSGCLFIFLVIFFICVFYMIKSHIKENENKEYEQIIKRQSRYYEELTVREYNTRRFRHDIKNQLFCLEKLLENDKVTEGKEYLQDVLGNCNQLGMRIDTGNYIVNIVVEDIFKEDDDIILNWKGHFPEKTKIKDIDLCILFSNVLKNAKEEIMNLHEKKVCVVIKCWKNSVSIMCKNAIDPRRIRRRENKKRGLGLLNVKSIVEKYGGDMQIEKDKEYIIQIFLYDIM